MATNTRKKKSRAAAKSVRKRVRTATRSATGAAKRASKRLRRAGTGGQRRGASRASGQDAVALLRADHKEMRRLLEELKSAQSSPERRERLMARVEEALKAHTTIEEEIFYPAFRDVAQTKKDKQLYFEAIEEHHAADTIMPEVASATSEADVFAARAKVLKELVEHHAEEEETDMFPRARKLLPPSELRRLGAEMAARKRSLQRSSGGALGAVTQLFSS